MDLEKKLGIIKQLYKMAQADNKIKPVEYRFLYEIALSMEIPLEKLEDIFNNKINYNLPKDIENKIIQIYRLALIMKVDKNIAPEEINTLQNLALQMGLNPNAVNNMLNKMNKNKVLDLNQLLQIFKTQNN